MMKIALVSLFAGVCLLAQPPAAPKKAASPSARKPAGPAFNRALLNPALLKAKAPDTFKATFTTTKGDFVVEVHRDWAPLGADRFYNLVKNGYFTDASFFRAISGFMVQFGISAYPQVTEKWEKAPIKDDPVKQSNKRGYVTFATAGPDTRTTQLFINLVDNSRLDGQGFAPFGEVVDGMDVVDKLYTGYGEGAPGGSGPDQQTLSKEGKAYLDKSFPQLDSIKSAKITSPVGPAPGTKPAARKPSPAGAKATTK